jgi:hypothetical protein
MAVVSNLVAVKALRTAWCRDRNGGDPSHRDPGSSLLGKGLQSCRPSYSSVPWPRMGQGTGWLPVLGRLHRPQWRGREALAGWTYAIPMR